MSGTLLLQILSSLFYYYYLNIFAIVRGIEWFLRTFACMRAVRLFLRARGREILEFIDKRWRGSRRKWAEQS